MREDDFLAAIKEGRPISFSNNASNADKGIDARWLADALVIPGNTLTIENALVSGPIDLHSVTIAARVQMRKCTFAGIRLHYCSVSEFFDLSESESLFLDLRGTSFAKALWLRRSKISSKLDLGYVGIGDELDLDGITVSGSTYAYGLAVSKNLHARGSKFRGVLELSALTAGGQVDFKDSAFDLTFSMRDATVGALTMDNSEFAADLILERTTVKSSTLLLAQSAKTLNCHSMQIRGQFVIMNTKVREMTYFEAVECLDLCLRDCTFATDVSAIGAHVFAVDILNCTFEGAVRMNDLRCDAGVGFTDCKGRDLNFDRARIGGTVGIGCREKDETTFDDLLFRGTQIGAQLTLEKARINGKLVLENARIAADVQMIDGYALGGIIALGASVGGSLSFERSVCGGPAEFTSVSIGEQLLLIGSVFLSDARFWRLKVAAFVDCRTAIFDHGVGFDHAELQGQLILYDLISGGMVSFQDASIDAIYFDRSFTAATSRNDWRFYCTPVRMSGCRYGRISVVWKNLLSALLPERGNH